MRKGLIAKALVFCFYVLPLMAAGTSEVEKKNPVSEEYPIVYYNENYKKEKNFFLKPDDIVFDCEELIKNNRPFLRHLNAIGEYPIAIVSYSTDSHKNLKDYIIYGGSGNYQVALNRQFFGFGNRPVTFCYSEAYKALSDLLPGKSYIISFVYIKKYKEYENEGVFSKFQLIRKYPEAKSFLDSVESKYVNLIKVSYETDMFQYNDKPIIEEYSGDTANTILHYGTVEEVPVKTPNGIIRVNKNALPEVGIGDGSKVVFTKEFDALNDTKYDQWFDGKDIFTLSLINPFEFIDKGKIPYEWLDLGYNHNYILGISIKKKEADYYLTENGWKVYVPDARYREYFDSRLKENNVFQPFADGICFKLALIQEKGVYEFVLEARPYASDKLN